MGLFDKWKKKSKSESMPMYLYTEQELDEYEAFIQKNFGSYEQVMHEIVSPDIHLDIIMVPPTDETPFYKMITMGMGAFKMNVPKELREYELEHAELIMYLPPDWKLNSSEERDYWPLRYLKVLGRLPLNADTWLGLGHTVHGNGEQLPFADNTGFNNLLLLSACNLEFQNLELRLSGGKKINFYQVFPLYQEELEYKLSTSLDELLGLFNDDDLFPVLNIHRRNYGLLRGNGCMASDCKREVRNNPWENVELSDYENHMSLDSVCQLPALNEIMKEQFGICDAKSVMILGIAGGNGLEHIDTTAIETVYGVDVNADYLEACNRRYPQLRGVLRTLQIDLLKESMKLPQAELLIANLLVEYIGYECFKQVVEQVSPKAVSCVIQINTGESFVSESPYIHSFDCLEAVHHQMEEEKLVRAMQEIGYVKKYVTKKRLPNGKKFVRVDFEI